MKKWLKIWIAALAIVWTIWGLMNMSNTVEAATWWNQTLKLVLSSAWDSTCTMTNWWTWSETASASAQNNKSSSTTPVLTCTFNATAAETLKLAGTNLTGPSWSTAIPVWNVKTTNSCTVWSTLAGTCWASTSTSLTTAWVALYTKTANKIWTWTFTETLTLDIPAWQIPWTYTGTLSFTLS